MVAASELIGSRLEIGLDDDLYERLSVAAAAESASVQDLIARWLQERMGESKTTGNGAGVAGASVDETRAAVETFLAEVEAIPGVARIERLGDPGERPTFLVYVRKGDRGTEHDIYRREAKLRCGYEDVRFELVVVGEAPGSNLSSKPGVHAY